LSDSTCFPDDPTSPRHFHIVRTIFSAITAAYGRLVVFAKQYPVVFHIVLETMCRLLLSPGSLLGIAYHYHHLELIDCLRLQYRNGCDVVYCANLFRTIYSESIRIAWIKHSTQVLHVAPVQTVTNTEKYTKTQWYRTT
jgi:hypothetical protein